MWSRAAGRGLGRAEGVAGRGSRAPAPRPGPGSAARAHSSSCDSASRPERRRRGGMSAQDGRARGRGSRGRCGQRVWAARGPLGAGAGALDQQRTLTAPPSTRGGGARWGGRGEEEGRGEWTLLFFQIQKRERFPPKKKDLNYLNILSAVGFTTRLVTAGLCLVC